VRHAAAAMGVVGTSAPHVTGLMLLQIPHHNIWHSHVCGHPKTTPQKGKREKRKKERIV